MSTFGEAAARLGGAIGASLGWSADAFWRATPAEVGAVVRALAGPAPEGVTRADLERLRERWPDEGRGNPLAPGQARDESPSLTG